MQKFIQLITLAVLAFLAVPAFAAPANSQACQAIGPGYTYKVDSNGVGHCSASGEKSLTGDTGLIKAGTNALIFVAGAIAVVVIIIGGIGYIASTGDPGRITKAKNTILYAVIGLIIAILAYAIVNYVVGAVS